jgi:hypothetical protein
MTFLEVLKHVQELVQSQGRISYRALQRQFELDDDYLEDIKEELLFSHSEIADEDGRGLVWVGEGSLESSVQSPESEQVQGPKSKVQSQNIQPPSSYTPPHLAERIRAATLTDGERKTITALFADLKGSTALIEGLDPEEARAIIDPALQLMMDAELYRLKGELTLQQQFKVQSRGTFRVRSDRSPSPDPYSLLRSRSVLPQSHRDRPETTSQIPRTPRHGQPCALVAESGQDNRSSPDVIRRLQLVY